MQMTMEMSKLCELKITKELVNQRLAFSALVTQSELKDMANGGKYLLVKFKDKSHEETAKLWNATSADAEIMQPGKAIDFAVDVKPYSGSPTGLSLIIVKYQASAEDPMSFIEWSPDINVRAQEVSSLVQSIQGTIYGSVASKLLQDNWALFSTLPAGSSMHHTEAGGLLWHTSSVAQLCVAEYSHFVRMYGDGGINLQLLIAGALLHDIGKVVELTNGATGLVTEYSKEAIFGSHLMIGVRMIDREAVRQGVENTEEIKLLEHMVAAHHGTKEFGALVTPVIPEAVMLFQADVTDANMWRQMKAMRDLGAGEQQVSWVRGTPMNYYKEVGKSAYGAKAPGPETTERYQESVTAVATEPVEI